MIPYVHRKRGHTLFGCFWLVKDCYEAEHRINMLLKNTKFSGPIFLLNELFRGKKENPFGRKESIWDLGIDQSAHLMTLNS